MAAVDFLKKELNILAGKFPTVHIKYGYNEKIDTHIVELLPLIEYTTNKELDNAWVPLSITFMETFENEEIAFISSDSSLSLKNVIFEFNAACKEEDIITELFAPFTKEFVLYNYTFPTSMPNGKIISQPLLDFLNTPVQNIDEGNILDTSYSQAA